MEIIDLYVKRQNYCLNINKLYLKCIYVKSILLEF